MGTRFVPNMKVIGAQKFGFPAKTVKNFKWAWQVQFLSYTLQIWSELIFFLGVKMLKFLLPYSKQFRFNKISVGVVRPYLETSLCKPTEMCIFYYYNGSGKVMVQSNPVTIIIL